MLEIRIDDLGQADFALTGVAMVPVGITAVMGPSGAGKSTLLSIIAGFFAPASGAVIWEGRDISGLKPGDRPVAILFQDNNLFPHLSVLSNVMLALRHSATPKEAEVQARAALARVGLAGFEDRKPGALSGGQQSRAALARVLLQDRPVVLLDEPFAALGPALKSEMLGLVASVLVGKTVLMVTHDPADARAVACHVLIVTDGRFGPVQTTQKVLDNPPPELVAYLGA